MCQALPLLRLWMLMMYLDYLHHKIILQGPKVLLATRFQIRFHGPFVRGIVFSLDQEGSSSNEKNLLTPVRENLQEEIYLEAA